MTTKLFWCLLFSLMCQLYSAVDVDPILVDNRTTTFLAGIRILTSQVQTETRIPSRKKTVETRTPSKVTHKEIRPHNGQDREGQHRHQGETTPCHNSKMALGVSEIQQNLVHLLVCQIKRLTRFGLDSLDPVKALNLKSMGTTN